MTVGPWVVGADGPELLQRTTPPRVRHLVTLACCSHCTDGLSYRARCTTSLEAVWRASDDELARGLVPNVCALDADEELERRAQRRRYQPDNNTTRRPGLLARLLRRSTKAHEHDHD